MAETKTKEADAPDKTPRLKELFKQLWAEKRALLKVIEPARADYERLVNDPRLQECKRIIKDSNPKLAALDNEIAGLARALGAKGIKIEAGEFSAKS